MRARASLWCGVAAIGTAVFAENLFGRQLNTFFMLYPGIDKILHTIEYGLVTVGIYALARRAAAADQVRARQAATVVALMFAVADESLQRLFPARSVETFDVLANFSGITLGWLCIRRPRPSVLFVVASLALATSAFVTYNTHSRQIEYLRGLESSRARDFVRAREHYQRAYASGMRSAGLHNELGWVEIESGIGDPVKAVGYASIALEMDPRNPNVIDTYGWALLHAGRTAESVTALERAYAASPDMFCIHYHLGAAYLASGRRDQARFHFEKQIAKPRTREAGLARAALRALDGGR